MDRALMWTAELKRTVLDALRDALCVPPWVWATGIENNVEPTWCEPGREKTGLTLRTFGGQANGNRVVAALRSEIRSSAARGSSLTSSSWRGRGPPGEADAISER